MAQHDYIIDNQTFPALRADLNNAFNTIATSNSGTSEPLVMYANMEWADTTNNLLKKRNTGNTAWLTVGKLNQTDFGYFNDTILTGNPTATTQAATDNSTKVATTAQAVSMLLDRVKQIAVGSNNALVLPNNLRILYQTTVTNTNAAGVTTINFGLTFASPPIVVLVNGDSNQTNNSFRLETVPTTTAFILSTSAASISVRVNWVAIGSI